MRSFLVSQKMVFGHFVLLHDGYIKKKHHPRHEPNWQIKLNANAPPRSRAQKSTEWADKTTQRDILNGKHPLYLFLMKIRFPICVVQPCGHSILKINCIFSHLFSVHNVSTCVEDISMGLCFWFNFSHSKALAM